jgi:hypothetical protein
MDDKCAPADTTKIKARMKALNEKMKKPQTKESVAANANEWMAKNDQLNKLRAKVTKK